MNNIQNKYKIRESNLKSGTENIKHIDSYDGTIILLSNNINISSYLRPFSLLIQPDGDVRTTGNVTTLYVDCTSFSDILENDNTIYCNTLDSGGGGGGSGSGSSGGGSGSSGEGSGGEGEGGKG